MPSYSYICTKCNGVFEIISSIRSYVENPNCEYCSSNYTIRNYEADMATISTSVKKSDSELKTLGDLALRNRDKFSNDQKAELWQKHNDYKENKPDDPLPKGMSRIKKPKKSR